MSANTITSPGTTFSIDPAGGSSYAAVAEVMKISGPKLVWTEIKTTHLGSANKFMESVPGFGDGGEVTMECLFDKAALPTIYTMAGNRSVGAWKLQWPTIGAEATGSNWTGSGWIKEIGSETPEDDKVTMTLTLKVTGKPTFTAGA